MNGPTLGIVLILSVLSAGAIFSVGMLTAPAAPALQSYVNGEYGITFSYPAGYILSEADVSAQHHVVTIIAQEDAVPRQNSEGPTAITIDFYEHATTTLSAWLSAPESHFSLGDGTYATTSVGGEDARTYRWSGLYEGITAALLHTGTLIAASVTYQSPADPIVAAYDTVLATMRLR